MWLVAAIFSALFAGVTAILSKCGVKTANSDAATAVRTSVVLLFAWAIVFLTGAYTTLSSIGARSWAFLILSGLATGASWICYFKALSVGEVSKVAAVDKSGTVLSVLFAICLFENERTLWWLKLIFLAMIAAGTFLMTDIRRGEQREKRVWFVFALLSAVFAAATSVLAKIGIENVDSNAATAIRTCVVLVMAWLIVFARGEAGCVRALRGRELVFLLLSGVATGASWLCYYYAIRQGQVSIVVPIDKLSILVTVLFSLIFFRERLSFRAWCGLFLLTAGTVCMAVFT
ncbi:MAG TPA: EamA family transporter [Candidatus Borkfalkia faecipullorum]|uniref:EamA family transporter n=1 Tax=Candidatus Borkfalkia faecipullorum TaxID=2838510 RepID=A0A9D1V8T7_9FIRM|nr:EamA family transporter [Candidatus Borkfalkia faecipullorum]